MAINKLYFSTINYDWSGHDSKLVDAKNFKKVLSDHVVNDYHTSIEDITTNNLHTICKEAKELILMDIDLNFVSTLSNSDQIYSFGRLFYEFYRNIDKVHNLDIFSNLAPTKITHITKRKNIKKTLWTAGCSFTFGDGILQHQRYGTLLSEMLGLPEITLSKNGASIYWAADQILRSDVNTGDILVWGLTTIPRVDYAVGWKLDTGTLPNILRDSIDGLPHSPEYYTTITHILHCVQSILQVINFCNKIGVKLIIVNFLEVTWLPIVFKDYEFFLDLAKLQDMQDNLDLPYPIDFGSDGLHPGPKQHKQYADDIFDFINTKYKNVGI